VAVAVRRRARANEGWAVKPSVVALGEAVTVRLVEPVVSLCRWCLEEGASALSPAGTVLAGGPVARLGETLAAPVTWEFLAIVLSIDGLIAELLGVLILMAVDYPVLDRALTRVFTIDRETRIEQLDGFLTEQRTQLPNTATGDDPEFHPVVEAGDEAGRFDLLTDVTFPEPHESLADITAFGFVVTPGGDQRFAIRSTQIDDPVEIEDDRYERWFTRATDRSYYRTGGKVIVVGFLTMLAGQALLLGAFLARHAG